MDVNSINNAQNAAQGVLSQISVGVVKQIQDSQEVMSNAIVGMINESTNLSQSHFKQSGLGEHVDLFA